MRQAGIGMALIKPSHNTGGYIGTLSNTKLFETMNAGLPVICSDFKLWKKIVEGNNVGICIRHDDEQALKDAIMKLVNDSELYKQMCENGKRLAREKYNWASQEKKLFAVYKKVLGE
jgi:glycosyltransferase involved in cell wall biosynthesis